MDMGARPFKFFRAGGFDQVRIETGDDLVNLDQLDWKLWVALACPTKGLAFDQRTLELVDSDKDGRIRATELVASIKWAAALLKSPDLFIQAPAELPLASINVDTDDGKKVHAAAKSVLAGLGKGEATAISVDDSAGAVKAFAALPFNGDGVVPTESAKTPEQAALIKDILDTVGGADDQSGKKGVTAEKAAEFFKAVTEYLGWLGKGEADAALMPLKSDTPAAVAALIAVRGKIDDYFARCRLAAFDARAAAALNREEKEYLALAAKDLVITSDEIKSFPLARIEAKRPLPLLEGVNPAWEEALATFAKATVKPLLGEQQTLTEAQWSELKAKLGPFEAWQTSKVGGAVEKLGVERLKVVDGQKTLLDALFTEEKAQESIAQSIASVEKLVRFVRDLYRLANNFVSFREFYERKTSGAIFQVGTLFLDQRACELTLRVDDAAKHATMAPLSRAELAYCDCVRPAQGEKMSIVAAFTAGDSDHLMVGRNGLFRDRDGKDWDATITRLVDNPISIRQAFWSPYKKALRFIEEQVAKRAADADKAANEKLTSGIGEVTKAGEEGKVPDKTPKKLDVGVVAALGVAVGGITAAVGALLQAFFGLGLWMPLGVVGLLLLISGPSMLIAWLKLRQRNIGPLLDANGWAINANAMLNVPFGASLTRVAKLPPGSTLDTQDPYAEARRPWRLYFTLFILLCVGIAWYLGKIDHLLPKFARSVEVLGENAPAYEEQKKAEAGKPAEEKKPDAP
jgi:hypothetical protein